MPQSNISHDHSTYRADCTDCEMYVGPKRQSEQEAEADAQAHKSEPIHKDCNVEIEVTQSH
jgi:hypothetical protein